MSESVKKLNFELIVNECTTGAIRWVSLGAVWLWCCLLVRSPLIVSHVHLAESRVTPDALVVPGVIVALLVIVCLEQRIKSMLDARNLVIIAGLLFGTASLLIISTIPREYAGVYLIGLMLGGAAIGILKIAWGEMYSRMPLSRGLCSLGLGLVSSTAIASVVLVLPQEVALVAFFASSVTCSVLLLWVPGALTKSVHALEEKSETHPSRRTSQTSKLIFSWKFLVLPVLVAFSNGLARFMTLDASAQGSVSFVTLLAEGIVGVALMLFACKGAEKFGAAKIYGFGLMFVVLGYLLISFFPEGVQAGLVAFDFGFSSFYFFMVVFWGNLAARCGRSVVFVYATGYLLFNVANFAGTIAASLLWELLTQSFIMGLSIAVVFLFFAAVLILFGDTRSPVRMWLTGEGNAELGDTVSDACAQIASRYDLTPREYEVLIMLARGRNARAISQSLLIAHDTAKSHIRRIYTKLGIHQQQELLDMVDESEH